MFSQNHCGTAFFSRCIFLEVRQTAELRISAVETAENCGKSGIPLRKWRKTEEFRCGKLRKTVENCEETAEIMPIVKWNLHKTQPIILRETTKIMFL